MLKLISHHRLKRLHDWDDPPLCVVVYNIIVIGLSIVFMSALLHFSLRNRYLITGSRRLTRFYFGTVFTGLIFVFAQFFMYAINYVVPYRVSCVASQVTTPVFMIFGLLNYWFFLVRISEVFPADKCVFGYSPRVLQLVAAWNVVSCTAAMCYYLQYVLPENCDKGLKVARIAALCDLFNTGILLAMFVFKLRQMDKFTDRIESKSIAMESHIRNLRIMFKLTTLCVTAVASVWLSTLVLALFSVAASMCICVCVISLTMFLSFGRNDICFRRLFCCCALCCEEPLLHDIRRRYHGQMQIHAEMLLSDEGSAKASMTEGADIGATLTTVLSLDADDIDMEEANDYVDVDVEYFSSASFRHE